MMIGILELLILVVVVPVVILMAAAVVRYLSQQNVSRLLIFGGLAVLGFLFLAGPGLFIVRKMSSSSIQNVQEATAISPQDVEYPVRLDPKMKGIQAEIPQAAEQEKINDNQPLVASKPFKFQKTVKNIPSQQKDAELPDWVVEGVHSAVLEENNLINNSRPVFQSGLFATREEALQDALAKARQQMQTNLMMREPWLKNNVWQLDPELFRQTAYRRPHFQTVEHDFGDVLKSGKSFKQDMFRAYVEIENTPVVRQQLLTRWKQNIGNERSLWVGGVFGLMTLMCIGAAVYLRTDSDQATIHSSH
ncbi:hypothetical protein [Gimesia maris]|nr:hypothetical protein [Gimesia maris]EDL60585.1 hypothetical protein PM8797T_11054 [Gimesia maris DSM 8797]QGQ27296.1 hypothetical protein F1729_00715 [Gimesia maris]